MENTRCKILLVEDNKLDQAAFERLIKDENLPYDYTVAGSVSEAQGVLACERFDIIISDYLLGDGTAFDVLESVKNTPIILVTGTGGEEVALKAWKAGAYDYLIKDPRRNYLKTFPITAENAIKHKKMEGKLQLLSDAIMNTVDSVYITDMDDNIIFVNRAFCETYGYNEEEIIGKDTNILWKENFQGEEAGEIFRTLRGVLEIGFYHKRKDGTDFLVSHSRSSIRDEDGNYTGVVGVSRNISEHILAEDKVETVNQKSK